MTSPDLPSHSPLNELIKYISPEDFLETMRTAFTGYVFSEHPEILRRKNEPDQWYAVIIDGIHESEGSDGVSEVLHHLMNRLGNDKRNVLLAILKTAYPDMKESSEFMQESVREADGFRQDARDVMVTIPEGFEEQMERVERQRANEALAIIRQQLHEFEARDEVTVDIPGQELTPKSLAIVTEELARQNYEAELVDRGGYAKRTSLKITETGDRLVKRDQEQAQALVKLVTDSILNGEYRSDIPGRYSEEAIEMAVTALDRARELEEYDFEVTSRGGYSEGAKVIRIKPPKIEKTPEPASELETLISNLSEKNIRQLEERILGGELLGLATKNGNNTEKTLAVLDRILEQRELFRKPVFVSYVEQLRENVENPMPGRQIFRAYRYNLPNLSS